MEKGEYDESGESINSTLSSSPPSQSVLSRAEPDAHEDAEEKQDAPAESSRAPERQPRVYMDRFGYYAIRVRNLGDVINDDDLAELFSDVGRVSMVKMHSTKRGIPIAFVKFNSEEEAISGIKKYDGYTYKGLKLECAPAYDKQTPAWQRKHPESAMDRRGHTFHRSEVSPRGAKTERKVRSTERFSSPAKHPEDNGLLKAQEPNGTTVSAAQINHEHNSPRSENGHKFTLYENLDNLHIDISQQWVSKPLDLWTVQDVVDYFRGTECKEFAEFFGIEQIDGSALQLLDRVTLCEHMKLGPALKIVNIINKLKAGNF